MFKFIIGIVIGIFIASYYPDVMPIAKYKFLEPNGVAIFGSPTLESQMYASKWSKEGHVNCKTGYELKALIERYFKQVFLLGMNDETLHTGYSKMSHYNFVLAVN